MNIKSAILLSFFLILSSMSVYADTSSTSAILVAQKFVEHLDNSAFTSAWEQTSEINHALTVNVGWFHKIKTIRPFLGKVVSRSLEKLTHYSSWAGFPDGEYLRISFATVFENKKNGRETVVVVQENNHWVVNAFFLK